jgi:parallel beta-helix repeat protein
MMKKGLVIAVIFLFIGVTLIPNIDASRFKSSTSAISNQRYDGNTLYVGGSGAGNYTHIQNAIDNASSGDTILVYNGTYYEYIIVDKQLFIKGIQIEREEPPTIDSGQDNDVVTINADGCLFENFKVKNVYGGYNHRGITLTSNNNIINKCYSYETGYDIVLSTSSNNVITNNQLNGIHTCIILDHSRDNTIFKNNMHPQSDDGMIISDNSTNNIIYNNVISSSKYGSGIVHSNSSNNIFYRNVISSNNRNGMVLDSSINVSLLNNTFIENGLAIYGDISAHWSSHTILNNTINDGFLYVYSNKKNITISNNVGQVVLYDCTNVTIEKSNIHDVEVGVFLKFCSRINIIGNTIISNHYRNMDEGCIHLDHSNYIIIDGNEITNGQRGICIVLSNNTTITNNTVINQDIGIWFHSPSSNNQICNNYISNCRYGIGLYEPSSEPKLFNNIILGNRVKSCTTGIWTYLTENTTISNNAIDNSPMGILVEIADHCIISGNNIKRNLRGIYVYGSDITIKDNNFIFNLIHAFFTGSPENIEWNNNYWGRPRITPKFIPGVIYGYWSITPTQDFDSNPRLFPFIFSR